MQTELVQRKLALMARYLPELEEVLAAPEVQFLADFKIHRVAERQLELLVECAAAINTEVSQAVARIPPADYYSSFFSLASAGWIDREVAQSLAQVAGLRNRIVHQYEDIKLEQLRLAALESVPAWRAYLATVAQHLDRHTM